MEFNFKLNIVGSGNNHLFTLLSVIKMMIKIQLGHLALKLIKNLITNNTIIFHK